MVVDNGSSLLASPISTGSAITDSGDEKLNPPVSVFSMTLRGTTSSSESESEKPSVLMVSSVAASKFYLAVMSMVIMAA